MKRLEISKRLPVIYKMMIMGFSPGEIEAQVGGGHVQVAGEMDALAALQHESLNIERVRTGIALDLDSVGEALIETLESLEVQSKVMVKLEYYRVLLQVFDQKAKLYGLNGPTVNINNNTGLVDLIRDLKAIGEQHAPELPAAPGGLETYEVLSIPATDTAASG